MRRTLVMLLLLAAGCAAAPKGPRPSAPEDAATDAPGGSAPSSGVRPADSMPVDAFELLTRSATDSCAICVKDLQARAFRILEARYPPGTLVRSDSLTWFRRVAGSANQLVLASDLGADPMMTFRFHTADDRLVGVAAADMTDEGLAERCRSAPDATLYQGVLEVVAFAYGDGPTFLYRESANAVEVHCRILELVAY